MWFTRLPREAVGRTSRRAEADRYPSLIWSIRYEYQQNLIERVIWFTIYNVTPT